MHQRAGDMRTRTVQKATYRLPIFATPGAHTSFFSRPLTFRSTSQDAG